MSFFHLTKKKKKKRTVGIVIDSNNTNAVFVFIFVLKEQVASQRGQQRHTRTLSYVVLRGRKRQRAHNVARRIQISKPFDFFDFRLESQQEQRIKRNIIIIDSMGSRPRPPAAFTNFEIQIVGQFLVDSHKLDCIAQSYTHRFAKQRKSKRR